MSTVTLSKKGWIVLPKELRERYGLKPGDKIRVIDYGGHITIIPEMKDPIKEARGMLAGGPSLTKALLEERRKEREREDSKAQRWMSNPEVS